MHTIVGNCPSCGAPFYSPSVWHGITPPPVTHTCACGAISQRELTGWPVPTMPRMPPQIPQVPQQTQDGFKAVLGAVQQKVDKSILDKLEELTKRQEMLEKKFDVVLELIKQEFRKQAEPAGCSSKCKASCKKTEASEEQGILHNLTAPTKTILQG